MRIFKVILLFFLLSFVYHLSKLIIEVGCDIFHLSHHEWIHVAVILLTGVFSFFCYKAITKKEPPEES